MFISWFSDETQLHECDGWQSMKCKTLSQDLSRILNLRQDQKTSFFMWMCLKYFPDSSFNVYHVSFFYSTINKTNMEYLKRTST